jgi:hypothetical protein
LAIFRIQKRLAIGRLDPDFNPAILTPSRIRGVVGNGLAFAVSSGAELLKGDAAAGEEIEETLGALFAECLIALV